MAPQPIASPTRELRQHHDIEAPGISREVQREAWQVKTRLSGLKELDDADRLAAERFQRDWDCGIEGVSEGATMERVDCAGGISGPADRQVDALSNLRAVQDALGPTAMLLLEMAIAKDASWVETGRRMGCSDKSARQRAIVAIKALTAHYMAADQRGAARRVADNAQNARTTIEFPR